MGIWPFRRKSKSKRTQSSGSGISRSDDEIMHGAGRQRDLGRHNEVEGSMTEPERRRSRRDSQKKRKSSKEPKKLQRDPERNRTYSFSPGRNDNIQIPQDTIVPPVPRVPSKHRLQPESRNTENPEPSSIGKRPIRANTQPPETTGQDWQRVPTLHKRSAHVLARRKSSKKRKEEHDREAEIKAMVAFMPTTEYDSMSRPTKRESSKMHGGLNRSPLSPSSDASLPLADSFHSSISSNSEHQTSYVVSALEMLSPRPTLRYSGNPRYAPPERSTSKKRRVADRVSIPEDTLKANRKIEDLADDLNASELRELMERDQKRRENRKIAEKINVEKRLARRQQKLKEVEAKAAREDISPPPNTERGVLGRDAVGLGIGTSAVVTSSKRKGSISSDNGRGKRAVEVFREDSTTSVHNRFKRSDSLVSEQVTPSSEVPEPVIETAQVGTVAKANISPPVSPRGHLRGASSISQMMELSKANQNTSQVARVVSPEPVRQPSSESSTRAPPQSWTSFFRRSKTKRSSTPSSFSNTSRDSMQAGLGPQIGYTPMRSTSNIPKRTMSKFREDLPELPISPPDSRVQSPEADDVPPIRTGYSDKRTANRASMDDPRTRYDTPTSGYRSLEASRLRNETPTSGHRSVEAPSPEPNAVLSQSMASIDSEGSWLSGRPGTSKRGSAQLPSNPIGDSASSLQQRYDQFSESSEELGIAEDPYFSRLTPGPYDQHRIDKQSAANASSEDEDDAIVRASPPLETTKWGAVARHPTVVHREPRAKSTEGLLNDFADSGSEPPGDTPQEVTGGRKSYGFNQDLLENDEVSLHRASSVDLGKRHARHISAGSARLLELKKTGDGRRMSSS